MPRVEDFPPAVRAELEARQAPPPADHDERGPMGLLKRLTHGLSRREEEPARLQPAQPREPKLRQPVPEARRLASQDPAVYAPRRGQIDEHGRLVPQAHATHEDDQLEIPAFLRRQAN
jgi:cell division protein FtsZ